MKKSLVDAILKYELPENAAACRLLHKQLMNDARRFADDTPGIVDPLPNGATLSQAENRMMWRVLLSKRNNEHYTTLMRRVFSMAKTAKSARPIGG